MAYAAWSVIAGEQPTAAKWNILGTNDASFNDGSGINWSSTPTIANGLITAKALTNPYKFSAYHNTTQSLASGSVVGFNTELFDTSNNYDGVNKFTAPVDGFYFVTAKVYIQSAATGSNRMELYKNGAAFKAGLTEQGGADVDSNFADVIQLSAGDYIQCVIMTSGGVNKTIYGQAAAPRYTFFGAFLVSVT